MDAGVDDKEVGIHIAGDINKPSVMRKSEGERDVREEENKTINRFDSPYFSPMIMKLPVIKPIGHENTSSTKEEKEDKNKFEPQYSFQFRSQEWPWVKQSQNVHSRHRSESETLQTTNGKQNPPKKPPRRRDKDSPGTQVKPHFTDSQRRTDILHSHSQRYRPYDKPAHFQVDHSNRELSSSRSGSSFHSNHNVFAKEDIGTEKIANTDHIHSNDIQNNNGLDSNHMSSNVEKKEEVPPTNPYPWRLNVPSGMDTSPSDMGMGPSGMGMGPSGISEFEYSMEPRNFSRDPIRSPMHSSKKKAFIEEEEDDFGRSTPVLDILMSPDNCSSEEATPKVERKLMPCPQDSPLILHKLHTQLNTSTGHAHSSTPTPTGTPSLKVKYTNLQDLNTQNENYLKPSENSSTVENALPTATDEESPDVPSYVPIPNLQTHSQTSDKRDHLFQSGVYDQLEKKTSLEFYPKEHAYPNSLFKSGAYDMLLPLTTDKDPTYPPYSISTPYQPNLTSSQEDLQSSKPLNSRSPRGLSQTPSHSPSPKPKGHARRRSEDLSELSDAIERCASIGSPRKSHKKVGRRQSAMVLSPRKRKQVMSPGIEESLEWKFISPGGDERFPSPVLEKRKPRWSFFGGDKTPHDLFNPRRVQKVVKYLTIDGVDVNTINSDGDTPLHCYVKMDRPDKIDYITALLVHCNIGTLNINKKNRHGNTPLHLATQLNDIWAVKALLAFGADINSLNHEHHTSLDLVSNPRAPKDKEEIHELFTTLYALPGGKTAAKKHSVLDESLNSILNESYVIEESEKLGVYLDNRRLPAFVFKLEELLQEKRKLEYSLSNALDISPGTQDSHSTFFDPLIARQIQLLRINEWKSTVEFKRGAGSRILFLDGGGIRGLIQIEVLNVIEQMTGRKITELFDWIVGSSTGGILALSMVYLGMSLPELRQFYFEIREEVFGGGLMSSARRTEALEYILRKQFRDICMNDEHFPKVLISAVCTKTNPPVLHFFNNCFDNQYSRDLVWKVARYTSAGPTYFTECDNYVDGGVMANNPSMAAWVEINKYYDSKGPKPTFAMAVSIGTGVYPPEELGEVNFFPKGYTLDIRGTFKRAQRLIKMLSTALVESEYVADSFANTCTALETKFFRFSPSLSTTIRPDETDIKVLLDMIIQTQQYLREQTCQRKTDEMIRLFKHLADISRGLNLNK